MPKVQAEAQGIRRKKKKKKKSQEVQPCGPVLPTQCVACPQPNVPILATQSTNQNPTQHYFPPLYLSLRLGLVCFAAQSRMPSPFSSRHSLPSPCSRLGQLSTARGPADQPPEPISSPFSSLPRSLLGNPSGLVFSGPLPNSSSSLALPHKSVGPILIAHQHSSNSSFAAHSFS